MDFNPNRLRPLEYSRSRGDGFFTNEAIRAGYVSRDFVGSRVFEQSLTPTESLRWEIEKQKIRSQLIAEDVARRRLLEEEIRMDLALERELVRWRESRMMEAMASTVPEARAEKRFEASLRRESRMIDDMTSPIAEFRAESRFGASLKREGWTLDAMTSSVPEVRAENRFSLASRLLHESVSAIDRFRPESGAVLERFPSLRFAETMPAVPPDMPLDIKLAGMKRKVSPSPTAAAEGKLPWLFVPRKKTRTSQSVWTCALCCVSCTSSDGLAEHYLGRKHRAKVEESKVKKEEGAPDKVENKRPLQNATKDVGEESTVKKAEGALDEIDDKHPQKHATKVVSEEPKAEGEEGALDKIDVKHPQTNATKVVVKESKLKKGEGALDKLGVNHPQRNATKIVGKESKLKKMEAALGKIDDKPPQKNTNMAGGVSSSDSPSVAKNVNPKKKMRGSKKQLKSNADGPTLKKLETQDGKKSSLPFWCEYCSIGCNSVFMLEAHLKGKKHAARLLRLEKSGGAGNVQSIHSSAGQATGASATTMEGEVVDSLNEGEEVHVG